LQQGLEGSPDSNHALLVLDVSDNIQDQVHVRLLFDQLVLQGVQLLEYLQKNIILSLQSVSTFRG
jgi:hypothetical protein